MYKVFLVDDEIVVREGVRNNINWDSTQYIFSGEAPDGELALAMIRDIKPDILITDIKMPFMDGLMLSSVIKKSMPWIKIIILSGHDEFDYAKQAISIGVEEYMLKPVSSSELLNVLDKVALRIEEEKNARNNLQQLQEKLQSTQSLLTNKLIIDLVLGSIDAVKAIDMGKNLNLDLLSASYLVQVVQVSVKEGDYSELLAVRANINPIVEGYKDNVLLAHSMEKFVLVLKSGCGNSIEETAYQIAQAIKHEVERNTQCKITVGIGSVVSRIGNISQSYCDAVTACTKMGALGSGRIIGIQDFDEGHTAQEFKLSGSPVTEKLMYASTDNVEDIINGYIESMGGSALRSALMGYYLLMDMLLASAKLVENAGGNPKDVLPETLNPAQLTEAAGSPELFKEKGRSILTRALEYRNSHTNTRYSTTINKAYEYINANFSQQDISLHTVAEYVALSPNHFSTVFSQETGETFIEYLTKVRITTAKKLLKTTPMLSSEITYAVGYNDPHYFSYIFKKHVGISPREFRSGGDKQ